MASVKLKISKNQKNTPLPNIFIDQYMPYAHPIFVTVYILGLRYCYGTENELTTRNIADTLYILESDVIRAWRYWADVGILELYEDTDTQQISIEYLQITPNKQAVNSKPQEIQININYKDKNKAKNKARDSVDLKSEISENQMHIEHLKSEDKLKLLPERKPPNIVVMQTKPVYSTQELDFYIENNTDIRKLFKSSEKYLGKLLSYNDMNMIFSFHDWLRLPINVIDVLLNYCTSNNHRNMRYIEKVAIDWADKNINTIERAREHIKLYNTDFKIVMKSFGINDREPAPAEIELMTKWIKTYKTPLDLIQEACKRAVLKTGKPNFPYADKIVESWHQNNISTFEEVAGTDAAFSNEKQSQKNQNVVKQSRKPSNKNRFVNYEQREWNFDELEELEQNYIDKKLKK